MKESDRGLEREEGKIKDLDQEIEGTNKLVGIILQVNSSIFSSAEPKAHLGYWYANGLSPYGIGVSCTHFQRSISLNFVGQL